MVFLMKILGKPIDPPLSRKSYRKKAKSVVSFTNEQTIICSQTHAVGRQCVWADHYLLAVVQRSGGGLSANEKEETFASNVKIVIFAGILNKTLSGQSSVK